MKLQIFSKEVDISAEAREYIEKKIHMLDRFLKRLEEKGEILMEIEVSRSTKHHKNGKIYYAEATMKLPQKVLRAEYYEQNIESAIDGVKNVMKNEIVRYKGKSILRNTKKEKKFSKMRKELF